jgi:hypothetical protein
MGRRLAFVAARSLVVRPLAAGMAIACLAAVALPASADAAQFKWRLVDLPNAQGSGREASLAAVVECPSQELCLVGRGRNRIAASTTLFESRPTWTVTPAVDGQLLALSCASPQLCAVASMTGPVNWGDNGTILASTDPAASAPWLATKLSGVSYSAAAALECASPQLCLTGDRKGHIFVSTNPAAGEWSGPVDPYGSHGRATLIVIECAGPSMCIVSDGRRVFSSTDPASGAWKEAVPGTGRTFSVTDASCPSPSLCVVTSGLVGSSIWTSSIWTSTDPAAGGWHRSLVRNELSNQLSAVSCPSVSFCVAATFQKGDILTTTRPTSGHWTVQRGGIPAERRRPGFVGVRSLTCPTPDRCALLTDNGRLFVGTR